jgi:hypothetical protein
MGGHGINAPTAPFTGTIYSERNFGGTIHYVKSSENCVDEPYSAVAYSIDIADTMVVSPTTILPIIVTLKNVGELDMSSATIWYSINGSAPVSKTWNFKQVSPWDMNYQDTAGTYKPTVNGFDTITIWVKMPNGQVDPLTGDDTLTKIIYASGDIQANLISSFADTVYTTGPHVVTARILSITGATLPDILLYIESTYQGVTTYDTLDMLFDVSDGLWKVTIPHYRFDSDVAFSIKLRDILGNDIVLSDGYYIERAGCASAEGLTGNVSFFEYFYTGKVQTVSLYAGKYQIEVWGADGGDGSDATYTGGNGGKGGYSQGILNLTSTTTLYLVVGEKGENSSAGISNGFGGNGGFGAGGGGGTSWMSGNSSGGGGGGGLSGIFTNSISFANSKIIAGGGGAGYI